MSHAYDARFAPTLLELPEILIRLEQVFHDSRIDYDGEVMQLHSRGGQPTVLAISSDSAPTLADAAKIAKSWFGVSLFSLSRPLFEVLGKSDAIEVYVRIFKAPTSGRAVVYNENSSAFRARVDTPALTADLIAFLVRCAAALEVDIAIYAEEGEETLVPDVSELESRLAAQATAKRQLEWLAVVAGSTMSFDRARELAGPWAGRVRLATAGYVVLPFLGDDDTA